MLKPEGDENRYILPASQVRESDRIWTWHVLHHDPEEQSLAGWHWPPMSQGTFSIHRVRLKPLALEQDGSTGTSESLPAGCREFSGCGRMCSSIFILSSASSPGLTEGEMVKVEHQPGRRSRFRPRPSRHWLPVETSRLLVPRAFSSSLNTFWNLPQQKSTSSYSLFKSPCMSVCAFSASPSHSGGQVGSNSGAV